MKVLVIQGPNLRSLGTREPRVYGTVGLEEIHGRLASAAGEEGVEIEFFQSDTEGDLVRAIAGAEGRADGLLLNPAAYSHTSVAIRDALQSVPLPCVEVHLSNPSAREPFRGRSLTAAACVGQISGFGAESYILGLKGLIGVIRSGREGRAGREERT